jgi:hypothetical protein
MFSDQINFLNVYGKISGKLAVIIFLEALERLTKSLYDYNGFPTLTLTFKNRASYIYDGRTATLQMLHFISSFSTHISTKYFKHAAHSPFFSSKYGLFHNATFFSFLYYSNLC